MLRLISLGVLLLACLAVAQRSPYASRPIPGLLPRYRPDEDGLGNRVSLENSTPLPSDLQGTLEEDKQVHRVSEWPEDKQPFWFKNRHSISAQRETSVDGSYQQAPRPRPPFAGGQQTIQREEDSQRRYDRYEKTERPSYDGFQENIRQQSEVSRQEYKATEKPYYNGANTQVTRDEFEKPYNYQHQASIAQNQRPYYNGANTQIVRDEYQIPSKPTSTSYQTIHQTYDNVERQYPSNDNFKKLQQDSYRQQQTIQKEDSWQTEKTPKTSYQKEEEWKKLKQNQEVSTSYDNNRRKQTYQTQQEYRRKPSYHDYVQKPQMR